jgi:hypothetical protein
MEAIVLERASEKLRQSIKKAQEEIETSSDPSITTLDPTELVLKRILEGKEGLHDPENPSDQLILEMASWQ